MKISVVIWRLVFLIVFIEILGLLFYSFWHPSRLVEPEYQGKKLTDWAMEIDQADFFRPPAFQQHKEQSEQAIAAIRHIGINALPMTLTLLAAKDSWVRIKYESWTRKYNFPAQDKHFAGVNIIWALGPMAKPAIPSLIHLLQSPDREVAENMMYALPGVGTNIVSPLITLLNDTNKDVRLRAAVILGRHFGSQARAAVPVLLQFLDDPKLNLTQRIQVIFALGHIQPDAPIIAPVIIRHIQILESQTNRPFPGLILRNYFTALKNLGTNAPESIRPPWAIKNLGNVSGSQTNSAPP